MISHRALNAQFPPMDCLLDLGLTHVLCKYISVILNHPIVFVVVGEMPACLICLRTTAARRQFHGRPPTLLANPCVDIVCASTGAQVRWTLLQSHRCGLWKYALNRAGWSAHSYTRSHILNVFFSHCPGEKQKPRRTVWSSD